MQTPEWWSQAEKEINLLMEGFTDKLRDKLAVEPGKIIGRKNPFLFRVRSGSNAEALSRMVIDAYLSSSEETIFGNIIEDIAICICSKAKGGWKSSTQGIDLEYRSEDGSQRTIMQIKSGPNWGNASQHKKLTDNFNNAKRVLRTSISNVRCVEGICYGKSKIRDKGSHEVLVGKEFWKEISDWTETHKVVLTLLGHHAENGLSSAKSKAKNNLVVYLMENRAVTRYNTVDWDELSELLF